jgi:hypothetical protein
VILMVFYPEWVGISGKTAQRMEDEQRDRQD